MGKPTIPIIKKAVLLCALVAGSCFAESAAGPPFTVKAGLFDQNRPNDLGLQAAEGAETFAVFRPSAATDHYSNGAVMIGFKGWLYCQWQSSKQDEDAADTWVAYSRSQDGVTWTAPMTLVPTWDKGYRSSGGWWVAGDTLVAYVNVWPSSVSPRGGYTEYAASFDGLSWSAFKSLPMADGTPLNGIFEQDPHALPGGRIIGAAHFQPGLLAAPIYTDDPSGMKGWMRPRFQNLAYTGNTTREMEPSWFYRADGAVVMVFRDQNSSFRRLASISSDRGASWSTPVLTDMPDSRSKQSAGNLPDGTAFQAGNPVDANVRIPLVVSLSKDGLAFDKALVLRQGGGDLQAQRFTGKSKTIGYNYPKSMVWQGGLYVSYATNKEDIEYTRVPLTSLSLNNPLSLRYANSISHAGALRIIRGLNGVGKISLHDFSGEGIVQIVTPTGRLLFNGTINNGEAVSSMNFGCGIFVVAGSKSQRR
jgi:hypothetical protein